MDSFQVLVLCFQPTCYENTSTMVFGSPQVCQHLPSAVEFLLIQTGKQKRTNMKASWLTVQQNQITSFHGLVKEDRHSYGQLEKRTGGFSLTTSTFSTMCDAPMYTMPPTMPITNALQACTTPQEAVIDTNPERAPFPAPITSQTRWPVM